MGEAALTGDRKEGGGGGNLELINVPPRSLWKQEDELQGLQLQGP